MPSTVSPTRNSHILDVARHVQEDRSGNSYAGGNGHTAKIARVNKLTGDVYEEKTSFGTFQSTFRAAKIKCKRITF